MIGVDVATIGETMALVSAPVDGSRGLAGEVLLATGGAESNVAVGVASAGLRSAWVSRIGADPLGRLVVDSVRAHGVEVRARVDPDRPTGLMVKHPSATGSRVVYYRAGSAASALDAPDAGALPTARVTHTTGITAAISATGRALVASILDGGAAEHTSFDVNFRPALWSVEEAAPVLRDLARRATIVFVGRDEAETLWGTATADGIRTLFPDVPHLIVKDGDVEAVEFAGVAVVRVPAHPVEVVEPVGAGDAFAAGWLSVFLRGGDAEARLRAGHDAAATVLRSPYDTLTPA